MLSVWEHADLIKVSEDKLVFLTGKKDIHQAVQTLWHDELKMMVVTLGMTGCQYFTPDFHGMVPGL